MQHGRVVAHASCQLRPHELNYLTHDLELVMIIFTLNLETVFVRRKIPNLHRPSKSQVPILSKEVEYEIASLDGTFEGL